MSTEPDSSLAERLNEKLHRLFVLLIIAFVVVSGFRPMMDQVDLGWHIAQGRWMVEHGTIYRLDAFNYPNLNHDVIDEYPLFQVVFYAAWSLGWWGPCLLAALVYAALVGILIRAARSLGLQFSSLMAMALGLMLLYLQLAFPLRPHVATYLGTALLGGFLLRHREAESWTLFWPMALLQVAWVNSHSAFVLGPVMVGLFGFEMTMRRWIAPRSFPWTTIRTWTGAFLLILLACLMNPYGTSRFYLPIYQNGLESIRAYVGEMEPLTGGAATLAGWMTLIAVVVIATAMALRRGAICFTFLVVASLLYLEALSVNKSWSTFGLFIPLLVLSTAAFGASSGSRRFSAWPSVFGHFTVSALLVMALISRLDGVSTASLTRQWREYDHGRTEMAVDAAAWMKAHAIEGRLLHRCEDGGCLQQAGYDHGETFADTGMGKYDEAFIHEVGLVSERPALLTRYLHAYQPAYVVCGNFCYQWPHYLKQDGWRPIFYSPNSSVWTKPGTRTDLPTVRDEEVMAAFDADIATYGRPVETFLYGRNLIALQSLGLEDFVFAKLKALPPDVHGAPWYWEAARLLCFEPPEASPAHRNELQHEAEQFHDGALTAEFRAW